MGSGASRCPRCGTDVPADARFCPSCGYATTRLSPGQVLDGKYEIVDKIAEGGMGQVYRARHVHLDEIRIIKVTKPDATGEGLEPRRFQEEARIATLVRHPNVAALYDFSRLPDGSFYMVWEFIDGVTLEQWLRRHGAMPASRALAVAEQILSGLAEIHSQGIVHRDLAPDNIMLREGPAGRLQAKIIDLGIAKRVASEAMPMTSTGMFIGKLKYCSPEQAGALPRGESVDERSDLYSFGVVLYEMLSGHPPFEAETPEGYLGQHLNAPAPPLDTTSLPSAVGPRLAAILKRALEKNRNRRFANADAFRGALREIGPLAESPEPEPAGPEARRRGMGATAAVAFALVLAAAIAAYAVIRRPTRTSAGRVSGDGGLAAAAVPSPAPTEVTSPAVEPPSSAAAPPEVGRSAPVRASSRSVSDASEAEPPRSAPTAVPRPNPTAAIVETPEEAPDEAAVPASMDPEGTRRFRKAFAHWPELPVERQAAQAPSLARAANLFVATYPDDPFSGELRQQWPAALRRLALEELDARRQRLAVRFYDAYRQLDFAPRDAALDRRFESLPILPAVPRRRPTPG